MSDEKVCPGTASVRLLTSKLGEHRESRLTCWGLVAPAISGLKVTANKDGRTL